MSRTKLKLPDWVPGSARQWQTKKRTELRATLQALGALRIGCAFTPAYDDIRRAGDLLESARKKMSVKAWR